MTQSQSSQGGFSLQMFGKPTIVLAHLSFKAASLFFYFFANFFTSSFIVQFLVILTLLSMDFWTVKNITGRLLVGLRWWNFVDADGNNHWKFESAKDMTRFPAIDRRVFWLGLVVGPAAWIFFVVTAFYPEVRMDDCGSFGSSHESCQSMGILALPLEQY